MTVITSLHHTPLALCSSPTVDLCVSLRLTDGRRAQTDTGQLEPIGPNRILFLTWIITSPHREYRTQTFGGEQFNRYGTKKNHHTPLTTHHRGTPSRITTTTTTSFPQSLERRPPHHTDTGTQLRALTLACWFDALGLCARGTCRRSTRSWTLLPPVGQLS